jgi:hypothetical protein
VLETIFCRSLNSVCDQTQNLQNCFTSRTQKPRRKGGLKQITSCQKVLLPVTFKMKKFCIAFYESPLTISSKNTTCTHRLFWEVNLFYKFLYLSLAMQSTGTPITLIPSKQLKKRTKRQFSVNKTNFSLYWSILNT